jgi:hypothetical protein
MLSRTVVVIVDLRLTIRFTFGGCVMDCFECAKVNDSVPAVGVCGHCGVGLCLDHLLEAVEYRVGGTVWGCPHGLPTVKPLHRVPAGIAAARSDQTAAAR